MRLAGWAASCNLGTMGKILVTGASGFVGRHLVRLASDAWEVHGVGYSATSGDQQRDFLATYTSCDLTDGTAVKKLPLSTYDTIIHLAGHASPAESFSNPDVYIADNSRMVINLCEPLVARNASTRLIVVSTGAVYNSGQEMPLTEESDTTPINPYVISKLTMESLAGYYRRRGLDSIVVRPFNHIGPGQSTGYLVPDLATKLHAFTSRSEPIMVGNLSTRRDYTDVRDVAKAYLALAGASELSSSLYNVSSGKAFSGQEILDMLIDILGLKLPEGALQVDQSLIRPTDIAEIYGNHDRLTKDTGWGPQVPLSTTLKDVVEDLR